MMMRAEWDNMSDKAILEGKKVVIVNDLLAWAEKFEDQNRHVAKTSIGPVDVSTVFLGIDHSFFSGVPLWFETMVFGGPLDGEMNRYETWEEAELGHAEMVKRVESAK